MFSSSLKQNKQIIQSLIWESKPIPRSAASILRQNVVRPEVELQVSWKSWVLRKNWENTELVAIMLILYTKKIFQFESAYIFSIF